MVASTQPSPLADAAALLAKGRTAAQMAAEMEAAVEATEALYNEMAPYWKVRSALRGGIEKAFAADRAMAFLAGEMFPSAPVATSAAANSVAVERARTAQAAVLPTEVAALNMPIISPDEMQTATLAVPTGEAAISQATNAATGAGVVDSALAPPAEPRPPVQTAPAETLASTLDAPFFVHRATMADATHQVMGQERGTLRRFREDRGDRPVDSYTRGDITGFLNTLRRCPTGYGKSPRDKDRSLADIIAEANEKGAERLKDKTVKRHLSTLSRFFWFAFDQGHISEAQWKSLVAHHAFRDEEGAKISAKRGGPRIW